MIRIRYVMTASPNSLSPRAVSMLKAALGCFSMPDPKHWGWRNHLFVDNHDFDQAVQLVDSGHMASSDTPNGLVFYVLEKGCTAIGVPEHRLEVAQAQATKFLSNGVTSS
jgi:hypothetical protein